MLKMISRLIRDEEGQGLAEYALILVLIAVVVVGALGFLGEEISNIFDTIKNKMAGVEEPV